MDGLLQEEESSPDRPHDHTQRSATQAPRSLRLLFEDASIPPDLSAFQQTRSRRVMVPAVDTSDLDVGSTPRQTPASTPTPDASDVLDSLIDYDHDFSEMHTAKQTDFSFPRNGTVPLIPNTPPPHQDSLGPAISGQAPKLNYRDIRGAKGIANISVPTRRPSQSSIPDVREGSPPPKSARRVFSDDERRERNPRSRNVASPANFTFPAAPAPLANSSSPTSAVQPAHLSPTAHHHGLSHSMDTSSRLNGGPPPMLRTHTAPQLLGDQHMRVPSLPRTAITRQHPTGVADSPGPVRPRPLKSASTSQDGHDIPGSMLTVPKPSGLRGLLNVCLVLQAHCFTLTCPLAFTDGRRRRFRSRLTSPLTVCNVSQPQTFYTVAVQPIKQHHSRGSPTNERGRCRHAHILLLRLLLRIVQSVTLPLAERIRCVCRRTGYPAAGLFLAQVKRSGSCRVEPHRSRPYEVAGCYRA